MNDHRGILSEEQEEERQHNQFCRDGSTKMVTIKFFSSYTQKLLLHSKIKFTPWPLESELALWVALWLLCPIKCSRNNTLMLWNPSLKKTGSSASFLLEWSYNATAGLWLSASIQVERPIRSRIEAPNIQPQQVPSQYAIPTPAISMRPFWTHWPS